MDFMWIMSTLKKVTLAKTSIASEMCHCIGLLVFLLAISLVIQSWEMLSILRQIGIAEE